MFWPSTVTARISGLSRLPSQAGTRPRDHVALELGLDVLRFRLAEAALEVGDDALERGAVRVLAALVAVADHDPLAAIGEQDVLERFRRQVLHRSVVVPAVLAADGLDDLAVPRVLHRHARPRHDRAVGERQVLVGDDPLRVYLETAADAGAGRAGAVGRVEAEAARLELVHGGAVVGAAVPLAVAAFLEVGRLAVARRRGDQDDALAEPQRRLHAVRQAARVRPRVAVRASFGIPVAHHEPIHDHLDRVALVLVQRPRLRQVHQLAVHAHAGEAPRRIWSKTRSPSVLRSLMTGPRTISRVPSGRS